MDYLALFRDKATLQTQLHWTLRITAALCFIGHGTWGLITKSGWLPSLHLRELSLRLHGNYSR